MKKKQIKKRYDRENALLSSRKGSLLIAVLIFLVVFVLHNFSSVYTSGDSMWSVPTAISMVREGNVDLDEFRNFSRIFRDYGMTEINGHMYNQFPIGVSLIALPFVYIEETFSDFPLGNILSRPNNISVLGNMEILIASTVIALTTVFIYFIARKVLDIKYSLFTAFIFAFCTSAWSTGSRALWQHGPSMLMLSAALYLILTAREKPHYIQYASLPLAFSYVIRPTNSISILVFTVYVLVQYRKYFMRYLLWALVVALPFFMFNYILYNSFLSPYYLPQRIGSSPYFLEALAGNLISPGRGFLVYMPVLLLSLAGIILKIKYKQFEKLDGFLLMIIALHWLAISSFQFWIGGWTIGPRFFTDMIPYFTYFLISFISLIYNMSGSWKLVSITGMLILVSISFFIQYRSSTTREVWLWNASPANVNQDYTRVWDWTDLQFLRGL